MKTKMKIISFWGEIKIKLGKQKFKDSEYKMILECLLHNYIDY